MKPNWSLKTKENEAPTLRPSVWRTIDCGPHFFGSARGRFTVAEETPFPSSR
ncbi:MAG: DUF6527 family protein [Pseudomonadota bacterium]